MAKPKTGIVYTLTDPRDGSIRYVGKTTTTLLDRLGGHLASPSNPAMRVWINALGGQGIAPHIEAVSTVPVDKLSAEEDRQIRKHAKDGHRILNSPYYQRNMADLFHVPLKTEEPKEPEQPVAQPSQFDTAFERMYYGCYGKIAAARKAENISSATAALYSLLCTPVIVAALFLCFLTETKVGRCLLLVALVCADAWWIGFDRLARDFVLIHVPTTELAAFWHTYLADPVPTLELHVLVLLLLGTWFLYIEVAEAAGLPTVLDDEPARRAKTTGQPAGHPDADVVARAAADLEGAVLPAVRPSPLVADLVNQMPTDADRGEQ